MIDKSTKFCLGGIPFYAFLPYRNPLFSLVLRGTRDLLDSSSPNPLFSLVE